MASPPISSVYADLLDFILEQASPEEIIAFKVSPERQARADDLIERLKADELTPEEAQELDQIKQLDRLVAVLKARALAALHSK